MNRLPPTIDRRRSGGTIISGSVVTTYQPCSLPPVVLNSSSDSCSGRSVKGHRTLVGMAKMSIDCPRGSEVEGGWASTAVSSAAVLFKDALKRACHRSVTHQKGARIEQAVRRSNAQEKLSIGKRGVLVAITSYLIHCFQNPDKRYSTPSPIALALIPCLSPIKEVVVVTTDPQAPLRACCAHDTLLSIYLKLACSQSKSYFRAERRMPPGWRTRNVRLFR